MKKSFKLIVMAMVIVGMIAMGTAFAGGKHGRPGMGGFTGDNTDSRPMPPPKPAGHLLGKYLHDNMAAETLSELTGKELATVKTDMQDKHVMELLEEYAVDVDAFKTAMDAKTIKTAQKMYDCGLITQEQLTAITEEVQADSTTSTDDTETVTP